MGETETAEYIESDGPFDVGNERQTPAKMALSSWLAWLNWCWATEEIGLQEDQVQEEKIINSVLAC